MLFSHAAFALLNTVLIGSVARRISMHGIDTHYEEMQLQRPLSTTALLHSYAFSSERPASPITAGLNFALAL